MPALPSYRMRAIVAFNGLTGFSGFAHTGILTNLLLSTSKNAYVPIL